MTRLDGALISVVKYLRPKSAIVDDFVLSSVHYKLAFGVMLGCATLTGLTSWYSPIKCTKPDPSDVDMSYLEQLCYANSTFTVEGPGRGERERSAIYPGVDNEHAQQDTRRVYVAYYQWVTLCLLLQAASFQVPRILWKLLEGGRVRKVVEKLQPLELAPEEERQKSLAQISLRLRRGTDYLRCFVGCQTIYVVNAVLQVWVTERFLGGRFISLVPNWLAGVPVLDRVFPKMVKCSFSTYGSGGSPQLFNALCLLAMNVLFEKIYLLLWAVLMFLLIVSVVQVGYLTALMTSSRFRRALLVEDCKVERFEVLNRNDWLLLKFIKDNIDDSTLFETFLNATIQNINIQQKL